MSTDPAEAERQRLREVFDEDAELYDRARPGYPPELYADLARHTGIGAGQRILEIACGTGQATRDLVRLGASVTAVELGESLAAVAARRIPDLDVRVADFDAWEPEEAAYDVVCCFTAWHWLDPDERAAKAARALRPGGQLAVVETEHVLGGTEGFFADVQECYERWMPGTEPGIRLRAAAELPPPDDELDRPGELEPVDVLSYERDIAYTADDYLDVLRTYSGHRALAPDLRRRLFDAIRALIEERYAGQVVKRYLTRMRVARRTTTSGTEGDR